MQSFVLDGHQHAFIASKIQFMSPTLQIGHQHHSHAYNYMIADWHVIDDKMITVQHELYYPVNGIVKKVNEKFKFIQVYPLRLLKISSNPKMHFLITFVFLANFNLDQG